MTEESKKALQSEEWQTVRNIIQHEAVKEYLSTSYADAEKQCEITANNVKYKVLRRDKKTTFYDENGNTLFDVDNEMLAAEYEELSGNQTEPETLMGKTIASIEKQAFDHAVSAEVQKENNNAAECIKGKSQSGVCGAAAYCGKGVKCCSECSEPCNSRCGWLDKPDDATEETGEDKTEKESDSTEKPADITGSEQVEEEKDKTEKPAPVYSGVDGAVAKLQAELEKAKDKEFAKPVIEYLAERCRQSESLAADICQNHKTWEKCYQYIHEEARKKLSGKSGPVRDDVVYEWAEDYFHLDDKALEEKKAKEEAERKKKAAEKKKQSAEKKGKSTSAKSSKIEKAEEKKSAAPKPQREVQKQKPKKNELEGQMDMFSLMGM
ncbi:MAG: PcfK-like family protein [Clostridium sp.]|nr:PcfK-like family protein [Clostridium sp.]